MFCLLAKTIETLKAYLLRSTEFLFPVIFLLLWSVNFEIQ